MPTALYLYNSRDPTAVDFYQRLKTALGHAGWELVADFDRVLAGVAGDSYAHLATQMRTVEAVVYAIGPQGPGRVQRAFEAGALLQARTELLNEGRELNIVIALPGGADFSQIPESLRSLNAQTNNVHKGGEDDLANTFRAVVGRALKDEERTDASAPVQTTAHELERTIRNIFTASRRKGLTLFIGPYAVADVHGQPTPSDLGRALLQESAPQFRPVDDLLAHPWIAAEATRLIQNNHEIGWELTRNLMAKRGANVPLPLHKRIAELAASWKPVTETSVFWPGLLLITADRDLRLENALAEKKVSFARLRCSRHPVDAKASLIFYEQVTPGPNGPQFTEKAEIYSSAYAAKGTAQPTPDLKPETVVVLKLQDCVLSDFPPQSTALHLMMGIGGATPPTPVPDALQRAPFIMLGGGLLNPLTAFAFANYFLPNFAIAGDQPPRILASHPYAGAGDSVRQFERYADNASMTDTSDWMREEFKLTRVSWPLPDLIHRLTVEISGSSGLAA